MELQLAAISIVAPITAGIVQALKMAKLPSQFAPLTAIVVGMLVAFIGTGFTFTPQIWLTGIVAGLVSQGLYSQVKEAKKIITG